MDSPLARVSDIISEIETRLEDNSMSLTHLRGCIHRLQASRRQVLRLFQRSHNSSLYELSVCIGVICECLEIHPMATTGFPTIHPPREYTGEARQAINNCFETWCFTHYVLVFFVPPLSNQTQF